MAAAKNCDSVRDAVFGLIALADLQGLQAVTPSDFDWSSPVVGPILGSMGQGVLVWVIKYHH